MNENERIYQEDEISLRELIEIMLRAKYMIIAVTLGLGLIAGIYTKVAIPKTYESSLTFNVANLKPASINTDAVNGLVDMQKFYPVVDVKTYMEQIKSPTVLDSVIKNLELKGKNGELITSSSLSKMITVSNPKDTNLINLIVKSTSAEDSAKIVNTLGQDFIAYIDTNNKEQSQHAADLLKEQLNLEELNLEAKSQSLSDFLANGVNISELRSQVSNYESLVNSRSTSLVSLESSINLSTLELNSLLNASNKINLNDLSNFKVNMNLVGNINLDGINIDLYNNNQIQKALLSIKVTNLQIALISDIAKQELYTKELVTYQAELIKFRNQLTKEETKYNTLVRERDLASQTYSAYQQSHKEAVIQAAANIGSSSIVISSKGYVPDTKSGPATLLNVAIGLVLGLMLSVFIAFFNAYWKSSNTLTTNK